MVWGDNNSTPIGEIITTNAVQSGGVGFDLWAGMNQQAGYYVYSFKAHQLTGPLGGDGKLNIDLATFLRALQGREYYSPDMYVDVVEAGFEIVRGKGWVACNQFSCTAE
jgi:hypothetical protein